MTLAKIDPTAPATLLAQRRLAELAMRTGKRYDAPGADLRADLEAHRRGERDVILERGWVTEIRQVGDQSDRTIEFVCSTEGAKRDGNIVRADGFRFANFDRNPVGTWCHDYTRMPVSRWVRREIGRVRTAAYGEQPALIMLAQFAPTEVNDFAEGVFQGYLQGFLSAVSIGWDPIEWSEIKDAESGAFRGWDFVESDLLECAHVLIPADAEALTTMTQRGLMSAESLAAYARWSESDRGAAHVLAYRDPDSGPSSPPSPIEVRTVGLELPAPAAITRELKPETAMVRTPGGPLSQALDRACDDAAASLGVLNGHMSRLMGCDLEGLYYADDPDGDAQFREQQTLAVLRCVVRMGAQCDRFEESLAEMAEAIDLLGEVDDEGKGPPDEEDGDDTEEAPAEEAPAEGEAVELAAWSPAGRRELRALGLEWSNRIGKKVAKSRLKRLQDGYENCARGMGRIAEVITEALEQHQQHEEKAAKAATWTPTVIPRLAPAAEKVNADSARELEERAAIAATLAALRKRGDLSDVGDPFETKENNPKTKHEEEGKTDDELDLLDDEPIDRAEGDKKDDENETPEDEGELGDDMEEENVDDDEEEADRKPKKGRADDKDTGEEEDEEDVDRAEGDDEEPADDDEEDVPDPVSDDDGEVKSEKGAVGDDEEGKGDDDELEVTLEVEGDDDEEEVDAEKAAEDEEDTYDEDDPDSKEEAGRKKKGRADDEEADPEEEGDDDEEEPADPEKAMAAFVAEMRERREAGARARAGELDARSEKALRDFAEGMRQRPEREKMSARERGAALLAGLKPR